MVKAVDRAHDDRRRRAADLRRQPDGLATPCRAAPRAAGVPRAAVAASTSGPSPSTRPTWSTWPARIASLFERSVTLLAHELRARAGVRGPVRERPHRVAPGPRASTAGIARLADGICRTLALSTSVDRVPGAGPTDDARARELGRQRRRPRHRRRRARAASPRPSRARGIDRRRVGFCLDTAHAWGAGHRPGRPGGDRRVAGRLRRTGSASTGWSWSISTTRNPSAARGSTATSTSGAGRIGAAGLAHLLRHPAWRTRRTSSRRRAWTRATTRSTCARARAPAARAARSRPCRRGGRSSCAGSARAAHGARRDRTPRAGRGCRHARPGSTRAAILPVCCVLAALPRLPDLADPRHVGRRPGPRHARAAGARPRRDRAAARPADVDRRRPPRRLVLLPAGPAAALTGGDSPLAVVSLIALAGIAAVGVVWWLARVDRRAGRRASSPAWRWRSRPRPIDESTFIWNPNLIALSSAVALAGAWRAWSGGTTGAGGCWPRSGRRSRCNATSWASRCCRSSRCRSCSMRDGAPLGRVAVGYRRRSSLVAYLPLVVNELTTDFSEMRAALDYLAGGPGRRARRPLPVRFVIVGLRVVALAAHRPDHGRASWPAVIAVAVGRRDRRLALARRPAAGAAGRALARPRAALDGGLPHGRGAQPGHRHPGPAQRPLPRLRRPDGLRARRACGAVRPLGRGAGRRARSVRSDRPVSRVVGARLRWNLAHLPPAVHPDGGFPAARLPASGRAAR